MEELENQVTEQETAGQESVVDSQEEDVTENHQDPGEGDNAGPASQRQEGGQSHQDNAAARAARIRAEQETTERLQRQYDQQVAGMGIINPRLLQIMCKPPEWCKIEASHRRLYIWPERIARRKKKPGGR
ncbi:hypothetical protein, partial [Flavonifractor sp. An52]|uniref:hypothetical protein n=1 Tax=Flavonifractor sp. An52 TaxID=1965642 RepID=UPI001951603B